MNRCEQLEFDIKEMKDDIATQNEEIESMLLRLESIDLHIGVITGNAWCDESKFDPVNDLWHMVHGDQK